jgi:rhomboid-like protein
MFKRCLTTRFGIIQKSNTFGSILFVGSVGLASFVGAALWERESEKKAIQTFKYRGRLFTDWMNERYKAFTASTRPAKSPLEVILAGPSAWYKALSEMFNDLSLGQQTTSIIIAANAIVFLLWRIPMPMMNRFMSDFFVNRTTNPVFTMLTSCFSHSSFLHFAFNMSSLFSVGSFLVDSVMGREQFLALYFAGGLVASLASRYNMALNYGVGGSIGASGCLFALFGVAANIPDLRLRIFVFPDLSAEQAFWGMMLFDAVSLIIASAHRASVLDHAAHLGGGLFGYVYYNFLKEHTWDQRKKYLKFIDY